MVSPSSNVSAQLHRTSIDLSEETRLEIIALLNQQLANAFDLFSQTKQAHWNVKGMQFMQLHALFDDIAAVVLDFVDMIAERVTALGGTAPGTARMAAANTELPELPVNLYKGEAVLQAIVERYAQFGAAVRDAIEIAEEADDIDTADLFTEVSRAIDKNLWFLEAHLQ